MCGRPHFGLKMIQPGADLVQASRSMNFGEAARRFRRSPPPLIERFDLPLNCGQNNR
jgi:hypothetical protein